MEQSVRKSSGALKYCRKHHSCQNRGGRSAQTARPPRHAIGAFRSMRGAEGCMDDPQDVTDLHASRRQERRRKARYGMQISGRSARLLDNLQRLKHKRRRGKRPRR